MCFLLPCTHCSNITKITSKTVKCETQWTNSFKGVLYRTDSCEGDSIITPVVRGCLIITSCEGLFDNGTSGNYHTSCEGLFNNHTSCEGLFNNHTSCEGLFNNHTICERVFH